MQRARIDERAAWVFTIATFVLLLPFTASAAEEPKLVKKKFLDDKLSLLVPEKFEPMSKAMLEAKYPSANRPTLVLTNRAGTVNLAINHTKNAARPDQLEGLLEAMEVVMRKTHRDAKWHDSSIVEINGRRWFRLDLTTSAIDTRIRNVMLGTVYEGRVLLVGFNTTKPLEKRWLESGQKMLQSLKLGLPELP